MNTGRCLGRKKNEGEGWRYNEMVRLGGVDTGEGVDLKTNNTTAVSTRNDE